MQRHRAVVFVPGLADIRQRDLGSGSACRRRDLTHDGRTAPRRELRQILLTEGLLGTHALIQALVERGHRIGRAPGVARRSRCARIGRLRPARVQGEGAALEHGEHFRSVASAERRIQCRLTFRAGGIHRARVLAWRERNAHAPG